MGLWAALYAERRGIDTLLIDGGSLGQGTSGGLLGALMPHTPDVWDEKKQFQFEALTALETEIAGLEAATGLSAGYRRCGRLMPLPKPHLRVIAERRIPDAERNWNQCGRAFDWQVIDRTPVDGWPAADVSGAGLTFETLSARVDPRALISVLTAALRTARHVRIIENCTADQIDAERGCAILSNGETIAFGHCIVAAGIRAFPMLEALGPALPKPIGQAVKGQAALFRTEVDPALPLIFLDGLFVVQHETGMVAVGSTSENHFVRPEGTDHQLETLIARARKMVPLLEGAEIVERWAGLRPKAIDRDPMVGPHPDAPRILALTGGFKVSFGLAHSLAEAALTLMAGGAPSMPSSFLLESHLDVAAR